MHGTPNIVQTELKLVSFGMEIILQAALSVGFNMETPTLMFSMLSPGTTPKFHGQLLGGIRAENDKDKGVRSEVHTNQIL